MNLGCDKLNTVKNLKYKDLEKNDIELSKLEPSYSKMFRVNLPSTEKSYRNGNGEGVWCYGNEETYNALVENNVSEGIYYVKIQNDSVYFPELVCDTCIPVEARGEKRPVCPFDFIKDYEQLDEDALRDLFLKLLPESFK